MTVLITGGAGYIGSHCTQALMQQGQEVVVYDNLSTGHSDLIVSPHFVQGDIRDQALLVKTLKDYSVTAVMHFASSCYVGESVQDPAIYYDNNVYGSLQLLQALRTEGVSQFIFSSSCATYGNPQSLPLNEAHPQSPVNPYGYTKRVIEQMLSDFSAAYGLRYVALRYFNAAGADPSGRLGEHHEPETHLIPLCLQAALGKRPHLTVYGNDYPTPDGTCIRDYIHINDIAQAHALALAYLQAGGTSNFFNIGTEHGYSVKEVMATCEQVSGRPVPHVYGERRPGDPPALVASAAKIKQVLGWKPQYESLEDIIQTAWAWETRLQHVSS